MFQRVVAVLAVVGALTPGQRASAQLPEEVRHKLVDATVYLQVEGAGPDDKARRWTGTAFHIGNGLLITNRHVFPGVGGYRGNTIRIVMKPGTASEQTYAARLLATHATSDLALLVADGMERSEQLELGWADRLQPTDPLWLAGFPHGPSLAVDGSNPQVCASLGSVMSLRRDREGHPVAIDFDACVAPGNSGGPLVDNGGRVVGVCRQILGDVRRAIPAEHVREMLGEAAMAVQVSAPDKTGMIQVEVHPRAPAETFTRGTIQLVGPVEQLVELQRTDRGLVGQINLRNGYREDARSVMLIRCWDGTRAYEHMVNVGGDSSGSELLCVLSWLHVHHRKPNGWRWDSDAGPEVFCNVRVDGSLVLSTKHVRNRFLFAHSTATPCTFTCRPGALVQIEVWDRDIKRHDYIGNVTFRATPGQTVRHGAGRVSACEITVRQPPVRLPRGVSYQEVAAVR